MFSFNPNTETFLDTLDFCLKLIGGISGLILFGIGFKRYNKDQIWKRNEFVAKEMKDFMSDKMVINAMFMLDWGERYIELFPNKSTYEERFAKVDREILKSALQFHDLRSKVEGEVRFTEIEVAIRDTFDQFFLYFERFYHFIEAGLITSNELKPYLNYWLESIATDIETDVRYTIYDYLDGYKFSGTQQLFEEFGKNIMPKHANLIK